MNASYKIVLLGAFVLFAAVIGYYIFSDDGAGEDLALNDDYPEQDPPAATEPGPRTTLEDTPPPRIEPVVEPVVEEETIGETPDELPDAPEIDPLPDADGLASTDPPGDPIRSFPEPSEETTPDPAAEPEEIGEPREAPRPAPGTEDTDPAEETSEPDPEPDVEPSPRPIPPDPATIPRTYTVKAGDTFASIAEAYYGDESAWFDIAQANPSVDPKRLQVGQQIVLPNRDTVVREREEVQPPAPGRDQSYTVRPGDNLSKIAKRFYDDSEKWDLIYARNRKLIGPRPDALKVGMELVIPQAYEGAE